VPHLLEPATSARSRCRGCGRPIAKGELRFGERLPNPFAPGEELEMTHWFHPLCAAFKRPEPLLETLTGAARDLAGREELERTARGSLAHRRLVRIDGAEKAPGGQARCRSCRQPIARGTWRIRIVYHEEGRFSPGGFVHLSCRKDYFEGHDVRAAVLHFSTALGEERQELVRALERAD
jgi:hypothetical protein